MCLNKKREKKREKRKKKRMKTQHLGWLSCSLLRGRIIYLKLLVASRTRRVSKWFYKIFSVETERQVNPCHRGTASTVGREPRAQRSAIRVLETCMVLSDISLVQHISRIDRSVVCMGRHMLPLCLLKF